MAEEIYSGYHIYNNLMNLKEKIGNDWASFTVVYLRSFIVAFSADFRQLSMGKEVTPRIKLCPM